MILVGERANGPEALDRSSTSAHVRLRHGAFRYGPSRERLLKLGLRWDAAMNLLPRSPRATATWTAADREQAREAALSLCQLAEDQWCLYLLGRRVVESFGLTWAPFALQSVTVDGLVRVKCVACPHPSGLCRWWNEPGNRDLASRWFRTHSKLFYEGTEQPGPRDRDPGAGRRGATQDDGRRAARGAQAEVPPRAGRQVQEAP